MWPYNDEELAYLNRPTAQIDISAANRSSQELVDFYIARARRMRAEFISRGTCRIFAGLRRWLIGTPAQPNPQGVAAEDFIRLVTDRLRTPLTSIRASSEVLRYNPDLPLEQRNRFLDSMLEENAHLERLIGDMLANSRFEPSQRRWQINAAPLIRGLFGNRRAQGTQA